MKQSFKFIYVLVIVVVILILLTMGMFVMQNNQEFTDKANISLVDTNEFNNIWLSYKGKQSGSLVKNLLNKAISNAKENSKNPEMLPDIAYKLHAGDNFKIITSTKKLNNVKEMQKIISNVDVKHYYTIDFVYSKSKVITGIIIKYEQKDKFEEFVPDEN